MTSKGSLKDQIAGSSQEAAPVQEGDRGTAPPKASIIPGIQMSQVCHHLRCTLVSIQWVLMRWPWSSQQVAPVQKGGTGVVPRRGLEHALHQISLVSPSFGSPSSWVLWVPKVKLTSTCPGRRQRHCTAQKPQTCPAWLETPAGRPAQRLCARRCRVASAACPGAWSSGTTPLRSASL